LQNILATCQQSAIALLKSKLDFLNKIAEYLLEKENITGEEFIRLLGESPADSV